MDNIDNNDNKIKRVKTIKTIRNKDPNKKICRVCKIEKDISELIMNDVSKTGTILMKNLCKECQKVKSKNYYKLNSEKVLKHIKEKYDKEVKKNYSYLVKFNNLDDIEKEFNQLKQNFISGLIDIKKTIRNKKEKKIDNINVKTDNNETIIENIDNHEYIN